MRWMRSGWTRTPDIVNCASEASTRRGEAHRRPPLCGGGVGWRGLPPPHRFKARTAASDGQRAFTRAARKRRAQVCGDSTVKSDGRWAGSPHPPQAVPLPLRGEGLNAAQVGLDFACRSRYFPFQNVSRISSNAPRRGAGLQVTSSTANAVPLPLEGKALTRLKLRWDFPYRT